MTTQQDLLKFSDWTLSIAENGAVVDSGKASDFEKFEPGVQFTLEGDTPRGDDLFVYVIQVGDAKSLSILYRATSPSAAETHVRIPLEGWLETAIQGEVVAVGSLRAVSDDEWPDLLGGRDGDMDKGSGTGSVRNPGTTKGR